jgi:hypothetical protein
MSYETVNVKYYDHVCILASAKCIFSTQHFIVLCGLSVLYFYTLSHKGNSFQKKYIEP